MSANPEDCKHGCPWFIHCDECDGPPKSTREESVGVHVDNAPVSCAPPGEETAE